MAPTVRVATLAVALSLLPGCGLLIGSTIPSDTPPPPPKSTSHVFSGQIRDFATLRPEPGARLEFWSDDPSYVPHATVTPDGAFSVFIEKCRRQPTVGDAVGEMLLLGFSTGDCRDLRRFGLRARLGDRCSFAIEEFPEVTPAEPLVLWLRPCASPTRTVHPWRLADHEPRAGG